MEQMEQSWETCQSLCRGKFLELLKEGRWEYVRRVNASGAVMIVAVTKEGELIRFQLDIPVDGSAKVLVCVCGKNIFLKQRESSFRGSTFHGGSTPKNILVLLPPII